jgi:4-aminobutyrate aminotransferase-like enzyme
MAQENRLFPDPLPELVPDIKVVPPGPRSRNILKRQAKLFYPGQTHGLAPFIIKRKVGYTVEDVDGNIYLDLVSGSGSIPLGSSRSDITEKAADALKRYGNEDSHFLASEYMLPLAEKILKIVPENLTRIDISLNGTEAVETAIRFMRRYTGRSVILGFFGGFHGESSATASLGAEASYVSNGLRSLNPGFIHVPYPNTYRTPLSPPRVGGSGDRTVDYIRDYVLFHSVLPEEVAGVIIEPIIGAGGCIAPPDSFWPALTDLCKDYNWLLCADEVKTGFGRSGKLFAVDHWGVKPDLMCLGKGLGGGVMPIGALLGTEAVMGSFDDISTGSTWSWLPASCAAAISCIDIFQNESILENVLALEEAGRRTLGTLPERYEVVGDVRIKGCFMGVEFVKDRQTKERALDFQEEVAKECIRRGIFGDSSSTSYNIQPSLITPVEVFEKGAALFEESIQAALASGAFIK